VRVLYDDSAIYVGVDCEQTHTPVVEHLSRRDRLVEADRVEVDLGTRRDHKSAFQFTVNAGGVLTDSVLFDDTESSSDWDENWDARVARRPGGWSVEVKIPLRVLRFPAAPEQSWDLQVRRFISERQEIDEWAYIPRDAAGEVSRYGSLDGLRGLRPGAPVELRPFALGRLRRRDPATTQIASGTDLSASAGLDVKWHPTQSLTLDATLNPDFAQVEADQLVLNLTKFETYYPEKRPFFLEGIDTFSTPRQLLYTRRIGWAAPQPALRSSAPFGEQLVDVPSPATIYGASKITGQLADGWTVGTLQALTAENDASVQLASGSRQLRLIDPLTAFDVVRVKRSLPGNGYVGAMFTATTRAENTQNYASTPSYTTVATPSVSNPAALVASRTGLGSTMQLCPDGSTVAPRTRCFDDAYVGAVDWNWRSPDGEWVTGGQGTATILRGPARYVPDGTVINSGDVGPGLYTYLNKEGGAHWVGDAQFEYEGRKLDYTDLGYNQRANDYRWRLDAEWRDMKPWSFMLERHLRFEYFGRTNLDGLWLGRAFQLNASAALNNFWWFYTEAHWRPTTYDDREVGDGTALERAGLIGWELALYSNPAKPVSFGLETQTQWLYDGFNFNGSGSFLFRALPQLDLEVLPTAIYTFGEPRFAESGLFAGQYIFGKLDAKSIGATVRATYTFAPQLTLQAYGQLFLASGHYNDFSLFQSSSPGSVVHLADLRPYVAPLGTNPDFQEGVLNMNVVMRWEYALGSTLFLVYTRSQVPTVVLAPGEGASLGLSSVSRAPAADVILVKLSYFWAG
jgi:hypothetical protein